MPSNIVKSYIPILKKDGDVYKAADVNRLEEGLEDSFKYTNIMLPQYTDEPLTETTDPDIIKDPGVYSIRIQNYTGTKWPKASFFGSLLVLGTTYLTQMLVGSGSGNDSVKAYLRRWITSDEKFSNWVTFELDSDSISKLAEAKLYTDNGLAKKVNKAGDVMSGNLVISRPDTTEVTRFVVENKNGKVGLLAHSQRGIWDYDGDKWVVFAAPESSDWHLNGTADNITGTVSVKNGGTGLTSLTAGALLVGNGQKAVQTRTIEDNTTPTYLTSSKSIPTVCTLVHWNGAYNEDGSSNLRYSKYGNLGLPIKSIMRDGNTFTATRMDDTTFTFTQRYPSTVSDTANGLAPKIVSQKSTLNSQTTDLILATKNGALGWYQLPATAFKGANITVEAAQTSGTHIGTITVDGIETNLYAPVSTGGSGGDGTGTNGSTISVSATLTSGTKIGTITVDGKSTILYSPKVVEITTSEINAICV